MKIKNPYYDDPIENFFDAAVNKVDSKLQTLPNKEYFTTDEIKTFLENEVLNDPDFSNLWDSVKTDISLDTQGAMSEIGNRLILRMEI